MTVKNLECFVEVAKLKSFSKAAKKLFLTPPAVTQQIKTLEDELGFDLFIRNNKGTRLTEAGECLCREAEDILMRLDQAVTRSRVIARAVPARLRLGLWGGAATLIIPAICRAFSGEYPHVELEFLNTDGLDHVRLLMEEVIDVILTHGGMRAVPAGLKAVTLLNESVQCLIPKSSALAGLKHLSFSDLRGKRLVIPAPGHSVFYDKLRAHVGTYEPDIEVIDVVAHETGLMRMLLMDAVALCPAAIADCKDKFVLRPFDWAEKSSIELVMRDEDHATLSAFVSAARRAVKALT